ncbi:MAG: glycine--tRNA ligase subunit beta [Acidiferrobacteraceae bacterium]
MNARDPADLLLEIGTEELPPKSMQALALALGAAMKERLCAAGVCDGDAKMLCFAAPRRLGVLISDVRRKQPARSIERRGPALAAAYDKSGQPTAAAQGFARSCGVRVDDLRTMTTDKGTWLVFSERRPGHGLARVLPEILRQVVKSLPIAKRMRWADLDEEFVRPVHWVVLMHGSRAMHLPLLSVTSGRRTRGHRFMAPHPLSIPEASHYEMALKDHFVIPRFDERAQIISERAHALARTHGLVALIEDEQLNEVAGLVEWPEPILGAFPPEFLTLPREVLITAMQRHQKYFPVADAEGRLAPHFITVANIRSKEPRLVRTGNERVLTARFADARFFWDTDRKRKLAERAAGLDAVAFQDRLGSMADKTARVRSLVSSLCSDGNAALLDRAAMLAKADLLTDMVGEFPELQGVMGRYYASADGEDEAVAHAIETHYAPRTVHDAAPPDVAGAVLGLADRIDTLVGMFGIGTTPTGDKDPFGLRRQALGVIRILMERSAFFENWPVRLMDLLSRAVSLYPPGTATADTVASVHAFLLERVRSYLGARWMPDEVEALLAPGPDRLDDLESRARAIRDFRTRPEAGAVIAANKRIRNILRQAPAVSGDPDPELLSEDAERMLGRASNEAEQAVRELTGKGQFTDALARLGQLDQPLRAFFEKVMVMTDDQRLRDNRLRLLTQLQHLFLEVADLSQLRVEEGGP